MKDQDPKITPIVKNKHVELTKFYHEDNAETLTSLLGPDTHIEVKEKTGLVRIEYTNYAVIDSKALIAMSQMINNSDLANVIKMAVTTKTPINLISNNTIPHTNETLQKYLEIKSESMYLQLIKRLLKAGILYQIKGLIYGEVRTCYILNPLLSRKRATFDKDLLEIFTDFKKLTGELPEEIQQPI